MGRSKKIDLKANLVNRTAEERQNIDTNQDSGIIHTLTL